MNITSVLITATGPYYAYFQRLLPEILHFIDEGNFLQILVATNHEVNEISGLRYRVTPIKVEAEMWPYSTTKRYEYFLEHWQLVQGKNVIWIDADMKIVSKFSTSKILLKDNLVLSLHPGFSVMKSGLSSTQASAIQLLVRFLYSKAILYFGVAGWEKKKESAAYVSLLKRRHYFQGGFWISTKARGYEMISFIANSADDDLQKNGKYAFHNDESYLNKYAVLKCKTIGKLPYGFVTAIGYYWNPARESKIICLDKKDLEVLNFF